LEGSSGKSLANMMHVRVRTTSIQARCKLRGEIGVLVLLVPYKKLSNGKILR